MLGLYTANVRWHSDMLLPYIVFYLFAWEKNFKTVNLKSSYIFIHSLFFLLEGGVWWSLTFYTQDKWYIVDPIVNTVHSL